MIDIVTRLRHEAFHTGYKPKKPWDLLVEAADEIERLRTDADRYETARRLPPRAWIDAWDLNLRTGKPFDEIIDDLRPFVRPGAGYAP